MVYSSIQFLNVNKLLPLGYHERVTQTLCHLMCFVMVSNIRELWRIGEVVTGTKKVVEEWEVPFKANLFVGFQ
jgi:hypothetical protein